MNDKYDTLQDMWNKVKEFCKDNAMNNEYNFDLSGYEAVFNFMEELELENYDKERDDIDESKRNV